MVAAKRLNAALYRLLSARTFRLAAGLADAARDLGVPLQVNALGLMLHLVFYRAARDSILERPASDTAAFAVFFSRHARRWHLSPALAVRGLVCLSGSFHARHRLHDCSG